MTLQSQFNLSVELTKLVPYGSLINTASRGLLNLARELRKSGSDIVAEQELAEIFGRNRIESHFASTFRTAVRKSTIHRLSDAAEIILEAGAGPTVKRSLTEQAYSSTIIQLSLLTWTHELSSLARALTKALERRLQGSGEYPEFPDQETLKGTLRACRDQTSGFMWELIFIAVETKLKDVGYTQRPSCSRPVPFHMLQALLDAFTAVQHFPDERFIRMETWEGVVTIVVWAHTLLGLTVAVHNNGESICFGQGHEQVLVDCGRRATTADRSSIALLNATQEVHFSWTPDPVQEPIEPACRHPALGYGNRLLSFGVEDHTVIREIAHRIVACCLRVVTEALEHWRIHNAGRAFIPSRRRILDAGSLLFKDLNYDPRYFDRFLQEPCLLRSEWKSSDILKIMQGIFGGHYQDHIGPVGKTFKRLCFVLLAFADVLDITTCAELPLDTNCLLAYHYGLSGLPTISESFDTLAQLLLGSSQYEEEMVERAALLSSWGWSIFLSSVNSHDPSQLRPEISIHHGVPCRFGERKEWIVDSYSNSAATQYGNPVGMEGSSQCTIIAQPGDTIRLQDLSKARRSKYFIDVLGPAFEVMIQLECDADQVHEYDQYVGSRVGFRCLQEIWWGTIQLPECSHPAKLGDEAVVPDDTDCFSGLSVYLNIAGRELDTHLASENGWVLVALVAGNSSARWILMQAFQFWFTFSRRRDRDIKPSTNGIVVLRGPNCCLQCAMEMTRNMRNGKPIGLVL